MKQEGVVLLHGILRTYRSMKKLALFLENHGYKTLNIDYPSSKSDLLSIVDIINPAVEKFAKHHSRIHFVGFSMGGLIIRAYLHKYKLPNLGRVVMLGTPNNGSEIADLLKDTLVYKKLFGLAGQQLITNQSSFKQMLGDIYYELGVIAGKSSSSFLGNKIIGKDGDGRVSVMSTQVYGMKEHMTINSGHTMLPAKKEVWQLTLNFLSKGSFK